MSSPYDVVVIGAGLGGLTAAALLARAGRKTLIVERNTSVGGAASTYKVGDLLVEAALHETSDPRNPLDPKHHVLNRIGVLDAVEWISTGPLYEARGGPLGEPVVLPEGFSAARAALAERFPSSRAGIDSVLGDMERIAHGLGTLSRGREAFRRPRDGMGALIKLVPAIRDWRRSVADVFTRAFSADEAVKCALGANLAYYHDDPATLWWVFFAVAQGGLFGAGGCFIKGGSQRLSNALARAVRAAGGDLALRRRATEIKLDRDGRPERIVLTDSTGSREEITARVAVANAAPQAIADMLPQTARARFAAAYAERQLSISVFSITLGLSRPAREFGVRAYSTFLLPTWMTEFAHYRDNAAILGSAPAERVPLMTVVDYAAIDSGLEGPPYPMSVVGVDRLDNWSGLDAAGYDRKRKAWLDALVAALDRQFPGLASHVVATVFNTASSMNAYLATPQGAVYGFAPAPPATPVWKGPVNSPRTPLSGLYLASAYAGSGGFTGAILAGSAAAECILAET